MRTFLLLLIFISNACTAQELHDPESLARLEMMSHQNSFSQFTGGVQSSDNFNVKYYRLEWQIDPNVRYITGKVTVYYTLVSGSASITMDLKSQLTVDSIQQRNAPMSFSRPTDAIQINFPTEPAGTLDSLTIWYHGVPANTGFGSFIQYSHNNVPVIWSLSEAYGARDWWPCKNGINDKADSIDVYVTHPSQYKAASNGMLQSETPLPNNFTVTHWKHRYPIATYLICVAVTNYATFDLSVQLGSTTLPMKTYCYPEDLTAFQQNTHNVFDAMQLYSTSFGEYPFIKEKYGQVEFGWGGGMEHQTSTFVISTDESLMAHELAHQWFGDKITCGSWAEIWLNEGFATFCAAYDMETKYPASKLANRKAIVASITSAPNGSVKVADTTDLNQIFNQRLTYNKGSYLLNMLRFILGDQTFFAALKRYQKDPALVYANAHTSDLERNFELESGRDLSYFFNEWYTGQGYPSYRVQWSTVGSGSVNIQMNQTTSDSSVGFFHLPVALEFKNATQQATVVVDNTFNGQEFIRTLGFVPDTVLVDPEVWLITKNNVTIKQPSENSGAGVAEIYPNPLSDPFTIYLHDFPDPSADIRIFDKSGREVFARVIALTNGAEIISVSGGGWAHGVYVARIKTAHKTIVQQLLR